MTDDDRKRKEEEATAKFAAAYMELLTLAAKAVSENRTADEVAAVVDDMPESMGKGLLITRVVAEATQLHDAAQQQALGDSPTLH